MSESVSKRWNVKKAAVLGAGVILLLAGVALFLFVTSQPDSGDRPLALAPGILAWLLAWRCRGGNPETPS